MEKEDLQKKKKKREIISDPGRKIPLENIEDLVWPAATRLRSTINNQASAVGHKASVMPAPWPDVQKTENCGAVAQFTQRSVEQHHDQ